MTSTVKDVADETLLQFGPVKTRAEDAREWQKNQWWQCLIEFIKDGKKGNEGGWAGVLPANTPGAEGSCDTDFRERLREQR